MSAIGTIKRDIKLPVVQMWYVLGFLFLSVEDSSEYWLAVLEQTVQNIEMYIFPTISVFFFYIRP